MRVVKSENPSAQRSFQLSEIYNGDNLPKNILPNFFIIDVFSYVYYHLIKPDSASLHTTHYYISFPLITKVNLLIFLLRTNGFGKSYFPLG